MTVEHTTAGVAGELLDDLEQMLGCPPLGRIHRLREHLRHVDDDVRAVVADALDVLIKVFHDPWITATVDEDAGKRSLARKATGADLPAPAPKCDACRASYEAAPWMEHAYCRVCRQPTYTPVSIYCSDGCERLAWNTPLIRRRERPDPAGGDRPAGGAS